MMIFLVGYLIQRNKDLELARPIYGVAILIPLITSGVALSQGFLEATRIIIFTGAMIYVFMIALFKKQIFIYLLTLNFGFFLYSFLKASQSKFTQHLVIYFLYILLFLGIIYLIPYLRKLWKDKRSPLIFTIANWKGAALLSIPFGGVVLVLTVLYALKASDHPGFCASCHNMQEYYDAWEQSPHKDAKCTACHYEPGVEAKVKGKVAGAIQLGQYLTNNYSSQPHAEVSNNSCMRIGCHKEMDFDSEIVYNEHIQFNHEPHMHQLQEDSELKCTTCHGRVVSDQHFTVDNNTCFICHFQAQEDEQMTMGSCYGCHGYPPGTVDNKGTEFSHVDFLGDNKDVNCVQCHAMAIEGDGSVLQEKCLVCHDDGNVSVEDVDAMIAHDIHLTENKQACFECHTEINHGTSIPVEEQALDCNDCHRNRHSVHEKMYRGTGGKNVEDTPDPMYQVNVACEACHKYETQLTDAGGTPAHVKKAQGQACDDCHGSEGYAEMAADWQSETRERLGDLEPLFRRAQRHLNALKGRMNVERFKEAEALLQSAQSNYHFVVADQSDGVHNYMYTTLLLDKATEDVEACMRLKED